MYIYKGQKLCLKDVFRAAEENKRKGISINFIWVNVCFYCGNDINLLDEEYSYHFISDNETCTADEIKNDMKEYNKDYSIYDGMYEDGNRDFVYIGVNEFNNCDVYYYYRHDYSEKDYCNICRQIW